MLTDYSYYRNVFHGDLLTEDNYEKYAQKAFVWLNYLTYGAYARIEAQRSGFNSERTGSGVTEPSCRYREASEYGTCLDDAECAVADLCFTTEAESTVSSAISKETVGDHSVTYRTGSDATKTLSARIRETAERYLFPTGLLYRGTKLKFKV